MLQQELSKLGYAFLGVCSVNCDIFDTLSVHEDVIWNITSELQHNPNAFLEFASSNKRLSSNGIHRAHKA